MRRGPRFERDRLQQRVARLLGQQQQVVENIDQVNAPARLRGRLGGDEEVLAAERHGVEKLRPRAFDQAVADDRLDLAAVAGDPLHHAVEAVPPQGRIEDDQFAHARHAVVAGDHADHLRRMVGDRPGVEGRIRPKGVRAAILGLPCPVRVHVEQKPREVMGRIAVFPAGVEDAAVVEHRRIPVVILVEAKLPQLRPSASMMNKFATLSLPPTQGTPWKQRVELKMIRPSGR